MGKNNGNITTFYHLFSIVEKFLTNMAPERLLVFQNNVDFIDLNQLW
jgi:hypothetical protein